MEKVTKSILLSYLKSIHGDAKCALVYNSDYELLISIILSAQTTDKIVNIVTKELFSKYHNIEELSEADINAVIRIIKRIGLYNHKALNIISCAKEIRSKYNGMIPNDFNKLINLAGVGRKTANVFLAEFYNENTLGVDTHIMRIAKRLNLASEKDDAYQVEIKLKGFLEDTSYRDFHHMMIDFGRNECSAKNPKCSSCELKEYCSKK